MAIKNKGLRKITNSHFSDFCNMVSNLLKIQNIRSDLIAASKDDKSTEYLYNNTLINLECIKPDDLTEHFLKYMKTQRNTKDFLQEEAVDALCIDKNNNFYIIEFKNRELYKKSSDLSYGSDIRKNLKEKMFKTLWMILSMDSMANSNLLSSDVIEFARQHITYIIVVSSKKNPKEYQRIRLQQAMGEKYTPEIYKKYKDYYLKDVFMMTERELPQFIDSFKV